MPRRTLLFFAIALALVGWIAINRASSRVIRESGQTYIVDRTGERWNITQAVSIGFQPEGFQYGLGRHAFEPLSDSDLRDPTADIPESLHVLGVAEGDQARAYSIRRLRRHEIANSRIGSKHIAAAF